MFHLEDIKWFFTVNFYFCYEFILILLFPGLTVCLGLLSWAYVILGLMCCWWFWTANLEANEQIWELEIIFYGQTTKFMRGGVHKWRPTSF